MLRFVAQEEYVCGARMRTRQIAGDTVLQPIGPLHAVRSGGTTIYGRTRAVCGADVEVIQGGSWPASTVGEEGACWTCERLTS